MELSALGWNQVTLYISLILCGTVAQVGAFIRQFLVIRRERKSRAIAPEIFLYQIFLCVAQALFGLLAVSLSWLMLSTGIVRALVLLVLVVELFRWQAFTLRHWNLVIGCSVLLLLMPLCYARGYAEVVPVIYEVGLAGTAWPLTVQIRRLHRNGSPGEGTIWMPLVALVTTFAWLAYGICFEIASLVRLAPWLCFLQAIWIGVWLGTWWRQRRLEDFIQKSSLHSPFLVEVAVSSEAHRS